MKLQNNDILNFFAADFKNKRLPLKLSFAIKLNKDALKGPADIYNEQHQELFEKHCQKNDNGEPLINDGEYIMKDHFAWLHDVSELLSMDVEANISTIDFETFEKCDLSEFDSLTVDEVSALSFMIQ